MRFTQLTFFMLASISLGCAGGGDSVVADGGTDVAIGPDAAPFVPGSPQERLAQKLSTFIWDERVPNPALISAVNARPIRDVAQAMVLDPRAGNGVRAFVHSWLDLEQLASITNDTLSVDLKQAMRDEAPLIAAYNFLFGGHGSFDALLTSNYTFVDPALARLYGLPEPDPEAGAVKVEFGTPDRIGIFGTASVMAVASRFRAEPWPSNRFAFLAEKLFCKSIGPHPGPVATSASPPPGVSIRGHFESATTGSACGTCHSYVNPVSFAFLNFDTSGRIRQLDGGGPIDSSGQVPPTRPPADLAFPEELLGLTFTGQPDLMRQLSRNINVRRCLPRHWLAHALQLPFTDARLAGPDLDTITSRFVIEDGDMQGLMIDIATLLARYPTNQNGRPE